MAITRGAPGTREGGNGRTGASVTLGGGVVGATVSTERCGMGSALSRVRGAPAREHPTSAPRESESAPRETRTLTHETVRIEGGMYPQTRARGPAHRAVAKSVPNSIPTARAVLTRSSSAVTLRVPPTASAMGTVTIRPLRRATITSERP
jgi:hypothetical protein